MEANAGTRDESESEKDTHKVGENVTGIRHNNLHGLEGGLIHMSYLLSSCSGKGRGGDGDIGMREQMCMSSYIGRTEG